jgi:hypothetical protein
MLDEASCLGMEIVDSPCLQAWSLLVLHELLDAQKTPVPSAVNQVASEASSSGGAPHEPATTGTFISGASTPAGATSTHPTAMQGVAEPDVIGSGKHIRR